MGRRVKKWEYTIEVPVYSASVKVIFTNSVPGLLQQMGLETSEDTDTVGYMQGSWATGDLLTILPRDGDISTLVHEASHLAVDIADCVGILPTTKSDEAFAYLLEHLVSQILECQKKAKKRGK